jgi:myo-inositol-1(or 4)-monophosphatase
MIDPQKALTFLLQLLPPLASKIIHFQTIRDLGGHNKQPDSPATIVTKADLFADKFLIDQLRIQFPQANFLTEETTPHALTLSHDFASYLNLPDLWIIDPIDGTANFARGCEDFMISLALAQKNKITLAVTMRPTTKEIFFALRGQGTWQLFKSGKKTPLHVSSITSLQQSATSLHLGPTIKAALRGKDDTNRWARLLKGSLPMVRDVGSSVLTGVRIARGHYDAWIGARTLPWDWAAISLLIQEAGGQVTTFSGKTWNFNSSNGIFSNGLLHQAIINALKK